MTILGSPAGARSSGKLTVPHPSGVIDPCWRSRFIGIRVVIDYAFYHVPASLIVGELVEDKGSISLSDCLDACTRMGACLLARMEVRQNTSSSIGASYSGCRLYGAVLDAEWFSEYRVDGAALTAGDVLMTSIVTGPTAGGSNNSTGSSTNSSRSTTDNVGNGTWTNGTADGSNGTISLG